MNVDRGDDHGRCRRPPVANLRSARAGLFMGQRLSSCHHPAIVLHPATVDTMKQAKQRGYIECVHPLPGNAISVICWMATVLYLIWLPFRALPSGFTLVS